MEFHWFVEVLKIKKIQQEFQNQGFSRQKDAQIYYGHPLMPRKKKKISENFESSLKRIKKILTIKFNIKFWWSFFIMYELYDHFLWIFGGS